MSLKIYQDGAVREIASYINTVNNTADNKVHYKGQDGLIYTVPLVDYPPATENIRGYTVCYRYQALPRVCVKTNNGLRLMANGTPPDCMYKSHVAVCTRMEIPMMF